MNLAGIERLLRERIGLDPSTLGPNGLKRAVEARTLASGIIESGAYAQHVATDHTEWNNLVSLLLVGETWFFRGGRGYFDFVASWLRERTVKRVEPVRVLSVPCSTGEEPYSLAIALDERGVAATRYHLDALDLSPDHIRRAREGVFPAFAFRSTEVDPRPRYFQPANGGLWKIHERFRESIRFKVGNLIDPAFLANAAPYDLILSRNLFIYLTPEAQQRGVARLEQLLTADGLLGLTAAEANHLPSHRFIPDGQVAFALFRRVNTTNSVMPYASKDPHHESFSSRSSASEVAVETATPGPTAAFRGCSLSLDHARQLADAGHLDEARASCERMLVARPTADVFALLGVIHLAANRTGAASEALRKALYLERDHTEAMRHMIVIHEQRGEHALAKALQSRLLQRDRSEPT